MNTPFDDDASETEGRFDQDGEEVSPQEAEEIAPDVHPPPSLCHVAVAPLRHPAEPLTASPEHMKTTVTFLE